MESLSWNEFDEYLLKQQSKILHKIWFGTIPNKNAAIKTLKEFKNYSDTWIIKNPYWSHIVWNIQRCKDLIYHCYKQHLALYNGYKWDIQRCDSIRYFILHRYGGLYSDMDYICFKSWSEVIQEYPNEIYLVETPNKVTNAIHISNSLMFSRVKEHVFWSRVFIEMEKCKKVPIYYSRHLEIMFTTGPGMLNKTYNLYKIRDKINIYPSNIFHPYGLTMEGLNFTKSNNYYAIHSGKGSWENNDSKLAIFLYQEWKVITMIVFILILPSFIYWVYSPKKDSCNK